MFGWLDKIPFWRDLPYPTKGALLRAIKAGLSVAVGILIAAAAGGILFPVTWSPMVVLIITAILQAVDKFLRESAIEKAANANPLPLSDGDGINITINTTDNPTG
jgi:hypothetical protein